MLNNENVTINEDPVLTQTANDISSQVYNELLLFSTFIFVIAALFAQFLLNLQTAILLKLFFIDYRYSLFSITYTYNLPGNWSQIKVLVVYGVGYLVYFVLGLIMLSFRSRSWKINLFYTWLSLILVVGFPLGLLTGSFLFEGLGVAFAWIIPSLFFRLLIASVTIALMLWSRGFWVKYFFKSSFSRGFQKSDETKVRYINNSMIYPWAIGSIILLGYAYPKENWYWAIVTLSMGLLILPFLGKNLPSKKIMIVKSSKSIFTFRYSLAFVILILVALWGASQFSVNL